MEGKGTVHSGRNRTRVLCGAEASIDHPTWRDTKTWTPGINRGNVGTVGRDSVPSLSWKLINTVTLERDHSLVLTVVRDSLSYPLCSNTVTLERDHSLVLTVVRGSLSYPLCSNTVTLGRDHSLVLTVVRDSLSYPLIEHRTLQYSTGPSALDVAQTCETNLKPI